MSEQTFYSTSASAAFALLGFWWIVVAQRYREWRNVPTRRRQAYSISLYFMLPALMSLASLVGHTTIWRLAFAGAAALGLGEAAAALRGARGEASARRLPALLSLTIALYAVIIAVAIHPSLPQDVGIKLKPLESEAIVVVLLLLIGVNVAWALLFEEPRDQASAP